MSQTAVTRIMSRDDIQGRCIAGASGSRCVLSKTGSDGHRQDLLNFGEKLVSFGSGLIMCRHDRYGVILRKRGPR